MKKIIRLAVVLAFVGLGATAHAQEKLRLDLGYQFNMPVSSSFKDFISNTSYRGFNGAITYSINNKFDVGLGASYNDFYQKYPRQVYNTTEGTVSAVVSNSIQVTPILVKASYKIATNSVIRPYVGVGAGANFISYNQYLGEFPGSKSSLKPALNGNAGVAIALGKAKSFGFNVGADFNYLPFNYNEINNLNNWGVHAGVFVPLR